jgi:hypothetical protein
MKRIVFTLFSLSVFVIACQKSKDAPPITKENIAGSYKIVSIRGSVNGSPEADADHRDECQKDDLIILNSDNTYNYQDAGTVCEPPGDETGTWELNGNLISSPDNIQMNGVVTSFDGTTMDVTLTTSNAGVTMKIRTTLKKQ